MHILHALLAATALVTSLGAQAPSATTSLYPTTSPAAAFESLMQGQNKSPVSPVERVPCPLCNPFTRCPCIP